MCFFHCSAWWSTMQSAKASNCDHSSWQRSRIPLRQYSTADNPFPYSVGRKSKSTFSTVFASAAQSFCFLQIIYASFKVMLRLLYEAKPGLSRAYLIVCSTMHSAMSKYVVGLRRRDAKSVGGGAWKGEQRGLFGHNTESTLLPFSSSFFSLSLFPSFNYFLLGGNWPERSSFIGSSEGNPR